MRPQLLLSMNAGAAGLPSELPLSMRAASGKKLLSTPPTLPGGGEKKGDGGETDFTF